MNFSMGKKLFVLFLCFSLLFSGFSSVHAYSPPAKFVSGFISSSLAKLMKWIWSLKASTKTAISGRSMMKFESGYTVETVFDGSKLGIEPYSVELLPSGELLIVDSANSNLYKISSALSLYSRPKLVAGSPEGYAGHVDGKHREARMNHPKGAAVDDRGNIYVADTTNMAIRKIGDSGVTTIAGGKWNHRGGHVDGPSDEAKFSNDFDVVYVGSSCSLLVIDRGNRAIREIQLHFDDCAYQYESGFPLGIAVLLAAGFFGYMLALLQRRVGSIVSSQNDVQIAENASSGPYQMPPKSVRPPLIPTEDDAAEKLEEGFLGSLGKLLANAGKSGMDILGGIIPGLKRKPVAYQFRNQVTYQQSNTWQSPESFMIPKEEEPPSIETRAPTPKKTYAFMSKDAEKMQQQLRQSRVFYSGWETEFQQQQQVQQQQQQGQQQQQQVRQQMQQQVQKQQQPVRQQMQQQVQQQQQLQQQKHEKHQYRHQHHSSKPQTYYEQSCEKTNEIVFGAVQEEGQRQSVIRPTDYAMDAFNQQNIRFRSGYTRNFPSHT